MTIHYELSYIKQHYRTIFNEAHQTLLDILTALKTEFACPVCDAQPAAEQSLLDFLLETPVHPCGYRYWRLACLETVEQQVGRAVLGKIREIQTERDKVTCHQCGVCCRFASSEFSYEQLLDKARQGDGFAQQFTSVFLPYASTEAAQARFPELVRDILKEVRLQQAAETVTNQTLDQTPDQVLKQQPSNPSDTAPVYFYHCPYIGEDNRCTIYGTPKRPDICAGYPDTPLTFIYDRCAWKPWKDEYHQDAMAAHAMVEICLFYAERLRAILN